jgi:hypothetical protein
MRSQVPARGPGSVLHATVVLDVNAPDSWLALLARSSYRLAGIL